MIKAAARINCVVKELGLRLIALLYSRQSTMRFDPFRHQSNDVDRERRRRVIQRFFLDVRAVLKNGWKIFVGAFGKVFADNHERYA